MYAHLVFDLETIPDVSALRRLHEGVEALSDEEVVAQAQEAQLEKTGSDFLPLYLQRVIAIACLFRQGDELKVKCLGSRDDPEEVLLRQFFKTIDYYTPTLVSWNGSGFDLPVLHYRALFHGVASPRYWDTGQENRDFKWSNYQSRYHDRHVDLMDVLARYNARAFAPLEPLARLCGFPGKLGMDGSQVWPTWLSGGIDEIRAYGETDVANTWLMYLRFLLIKGQLDQAGYEQEVALVRSTLSAQSQAPWPEYMAAWDATTALK